MLFLVVLFLSMLIVAHTNSIHGGTYLAMAGKDSVVLAADSRFSSQQTGTMMVGEHPRPIYRIGSKVLIGCFGLESDMKILMKALRGKLRGISDDAIQPNNVARLVSTLLYKLGLILSPIIVGISSEGKPYICCMDGIGAQTVSDKFAVVGTANSALYGLCESLYCPELQPEQLASIAEDCLSTALERDILSGCKVRLFTITKNAIYQKEFYTSDQ